MILLTLCKASAGLVAEARPLPQERVGARNHLNRSVITVALLVSLVKMPTASLRLHLWTCKYGERSFFSFFPCSRFEHSCPKTAMSSKMQSSSSIAHARRTVHQLRVEASIERIKVPFLYSVVHMSRLLYFYSVHVLGRSPLWTGFSAGVQGFIWPDALLCRTRQEWPAADGHPRFRKPFQGQEALHCSVEEPLNSYCFPFHSCMGGKKTDRNIVHSLS